MTKTKTKTAAATKTAKKGKKENVAAAAPAAAAAATAAAAAAKKKPGGRTTGSSTTTAPAVAPTAPVAPSAAPVLTAASSAGKAELIKKISVAPKYHANLTAASLARTVKDVCDKKIAADVKVYFTTQVKIKDEYKAVLEALATALEAEKEIFFPGCGGLKQEEYQKIFLHLLAHYLGDRFIFGAAPAVAPAPASPKVPFKDVLNCILKDATLKDQFEDTAAELNQNRKKKLSDLEVLKHESCSPTVRSALRKHSKTLGRAITIDDIDFSAPAAPAPSAKAGSKKKKDQDSSDESSGDDGSSGADDSDDDDEDKANVPPGDAFSESEIDEEAGEIPTIDNKAAPNSVEFRTILDRRCRVVSGTVMTGDQAEQNVYDGYLEIYPLLAGTPPEPRLVRKMIKLTLPRVYDRTAENRKKSRSQQAALAAARQFIMVVVGDHHHHVIFLGIARVIWESILRCAHSSAYRAFKISADLRKYITAPGNTLDVCGHVGNLLLSFMEDGYQSFSHDRAMFHNALKEVNGCFSASFINNMEAYTRSQDLVKNLLILIPALARAIIVGHATTTNANLDEFDREVRVGCLALYPVLRGNQYLELANEGIKAMLVGQGQDGALANRGAFDAATASCALFNQARELYKHQDGSGFAARLQLTKASKSAAGSTGSTTTHFTGSMTVKRENGTIVTNTQTQGTRRARVESDDDDEDADEEEMPKKKKKTTTTAKPLPPITPVDISGVLKDKVFQGVKVIKSLKVGGECIFHGHGGIGGAHKTKECYMWTSLTPAQKAKIHAKCSQFPK